MQLMQIEEVFSIKNIKYEMILKQNTNQLLNIMSITVHY